MASTYLSRTMGTATNRKKCTLSVWLKRAIVNNSSYHFFVSSYNSSSDRLGFYFNTGDTLDVYCPGTNSMHVGTNKVFRDVNSWYHVVFKIDSTQSTASDRVKIYVNGQQETSLSNSTYPNQNDDLAFGTSSYNMYIGNYEGSNYYYDGSMSHLHFCDGYAYEPTEFGSTDATTGEWKITTNPNVNYGNQGFAILKDGMTITDQSSNSNNFTLGGGTLTKTEDNPSNVFCTLNPLQKADTGMSVTYSFGNTKYAGNSSAWQRAYGTIGANAGKYFYEFKCLNHSGTADTLRVGWDSIDSINSGTDNYYSGLTIDTVGKLRGGEDGYSGYDPNAVQMTAAYSGGNFSFGVGDILGMAIDIDNNTFSVYKNGYLEINAYSYASASNCSLLKSKGHFIAPSVNWFSTSGNNNRSCFNFGNGYFETTAISSEGTNASGIGKFEYNVPANYTAFSTKGLNE